MDTTNPAVAKHYDLPPAVLDELEKNPEFLRTMARKYLLLHMSIQNRKLRDFDASPAARQSYMDTLMKIGDVGPKPVVQAQTGGGFTLNIIGGSSEQQKVEIERLTKLRLAAATATDVASTETPNV